MIEHLLLTGLMALRSRRMGEETRIIDERIYFSSTKSGPITNISIG